MFNGARFFVVLVQFYNGRGCASPTPPPMFGGLRPAQPPRLCLAEPGVLRRCCSVLCLAKPDVLRRSCSVLSWGGCAPPNPPAFVWRSQTFLVVLVQLYHGGAAPTPPPMFNGARRSSLFLFSSILGGAQPPQPPRLCLAGCAPPNPPASVWRSPTFFVVLVQFYHGGAAVRPDLAHLFSIKKPRVLPTLSATF